MTEIKKEKPAIFKQRNEVTNNDFIAIETFDEKIFLGFLIGQHNGFMYIIEELSLISEDIQDITQAVAEPEWIFYTGGARAINLNNIRSFFPPSEFLKSVYQKGVLKIKNKAEGKEEIKDFKDEYFTSKTLH